jgi:hypothetical protein
MNRNEHEAISHGQGARLRAFFQAAASPRADTSRSTLTARLRADGIPEDHLDPILNGYVGLVRKARAGETGHLQLSHDADALTLKFVRAIRSADDLLGDDGIPTGNGAEHDWQTADRVLGRARGLSDEQIDQERKDREERERLQRLGIRANI